MLDDDFARSMGDFEDLAALRTGVKERLERNALDKARHEFADQIIDYAVANATLDLPDVLIDQEVEVMHDEFRSTLARQGVSARRPTSRSPARPRPTSTPTSGPTPRSASRSCWSSPRSPRTRASRSPTPTSTLEIERGRQRYSGDPKLTKLLRVRAWAELHPLDAAPEPDRRAPRRRLARRPSGPSGAARTSRTVRAALFDSPSAEASGAIDATDPDRPRRATTTTTTTTMTTNTTTITSRRPPAEPSATNLATGHSGDPRCSCRW